MIQHSPRMTCNAKLMMFIKFNRYFNIYFDSLRFDLFDEFNAETEKSDEIFNLQLTHTKRTTDKKVACMDKILDDMRKKFDTEQNLINENEPNETEKPMNEQQLNLNTDTEVSLINKETIIADSSNVKELTEEKQVEISDVEMEETIDTSITKQADTSESKESNEIQQAEQSNMIVSTDETLVDSSDVQMQELNEIKEAEPINTNELTEEKIADSSVTKEIIETNKTNSIPKKLTEESLVDSSNIQIQESSEPIESNEKQPENSCDTKETTEDLAPDSSNTELNESNQADLSNTKEPAEALLPDSSTNIQMNNITCEPEDKSNSKSEAALPSFTTDFDIEHIKETSVSIKQQIDNRLPISLINTSTSSLDNEQSGLQKQDQIIIINSSTFEEAVNDTLMDLLNVNFPY